MSEPDGPSAITPAAFAVVDLGGTKILTLIVDSTLRVLAEDRRPSQPAQGPGVVVRRVAESIDAALDRAPGLTRPSTIASRRPAPSTCAQAQQIR